MTVNVHAVHFEADAKLLEHIDKKIVKLANHHDRIMAVDVFLKLDNVLLTPHIGSATLETRIAMTNLAVDNLEAFFTQQPLLTEVHY